MLFRKLHLFRIIEEHQHMCNLRWSALESSTQTYHSNAFAARIDRYTTWEWQPAKHIAHIFDFSTLPHIAHRTSGFHRCVVSKAHFCSHLVSSSPITCHRSSLSPVLLPCSASSATRNSAPSAGATPTGGSNLGVRMTGHAAAKSDAWFKLV